MIAEPVAAPDPTTTFVATHQAALWRWLKALGCDTASAEEHVQDALLAGLEHALDRQPTASARRWLRTAARNLFWMQLRRQRRRPLIVDATLVEAAWQQLRGDEDGDPALTALAGCLGSLVERDRLAIDLRYRDRCSRRDMAERLGIGEHGVKMALRRARARLLDCMRGKLGQEAV